MILSNKLHIFLTIIMSVIAIDCCGSEQKCLEVIRHLNQVGQKLNNNGKETVYTYNDLLKYVQTLKKENFAESDRAFLLQLFVCTYSPKTKGTALEGCIRTLMQLFGANAKRTEPGSTWQTALHVVDDSYVATILLKEGNANPYAQILSGDDPVQSNSNNMQKMEVINLIKEEQKKICYVCEQKLPSESNNNITCIQGNHKGHLDCYKKVKNLCSNKCVVCEKLLARQDLSEFLENCLEKKLVENLQNTKESVFGVSSDYNIIAHNFFVENILEKHGNKFFYYKSDPFTYKLFREEFAKKYNQIIEKNAQVIEKNAQDFSYKVKDLGKELAQKHVRKTN